MATIQSIPTRIQQKHDTANNWENSNTFIPRLGEWIVYEAEFDANGAQTVPPRVKIGDGIHIVKALPFVVLDELAPVARTGVYNDLTQKPDLSFNGIAAILGLTSAQLSQLIALAKLTTVTEGQGVTLAADLKANSYDTNV